MPRARREVPLINNGEEVADEIAVYYSLRL
jgi:hypothetical protein